MKPTSLSCKVFLVQAAFMLIFSLVSLPAQAAPTFSTIQIAIEGAADGGTVNIPAGNYSETLTINNKSITLVGPTTGTATLHAAGTGQRIITLNGDGKSLTLRNLTLTGADISANSAPSPEAGGAVFLNNGSLTVDHCHMNNNRAKYGGAIFQGGTGFVIILNSTFEENHATLHGGAIYTNGSLSLTGVTLSLNHASQHGGGASVMGNLNVQGGQVTSNTASGNGGGLNVNESVTLNGVTIDHNISGDQGGGVNQWNAINGALVNVTDTTFDNNQAVFKGGGLNVANGAETMITASKFLNNVADTKNINDNSLKVYGGGVNFSGTLPNRSITIETTTFKNNKSAASSCATFQCPFPMGGGVYANVLSGGKVIITDDQFESNNAWDGGGLSASNADILRATFISNTAGYGAGGTISGTSTVRQSSFLQNSAANQGGALQLSCPSFNVSNSVFSDNQAVSGTGDAGTFRISNVTGTGTLENVVVKNTKAGNGSAILFANNPGTININHLTLNWVTNTNTYTTPTPVGIEWIYIGQTNRGQLNISNSIIANVNDANAIAVKSDGSGLVTVDHTLFYQVANRASLTVTQQYIEVGDPLFKSDKYHIQPGSMAVGKAIITSVTKDIDGEPRDAAHPDMGADELFSYVFIPLARK